MRYPLVFSLMCGLLAGGLFLALVVGIGQLSKRSESDGLGPVTEFEQYEATPEGKPICPKCGRTDDVRKFLYGLRREAPPEGMTNGGCCSGPKSPEYRCLHCEATFGITSQGK